MVSDGVRIALRKALKDSKTGTFRIRVGSLLQFHLPKSAAVGGVYTSKAGRPKVSMTFTVKEVLLPKEGSGSGGRGDGGSKKRKRSED